jgi:T5orf172 domain
MAGYVYLLEEVAHGDGDSGPWTKIGCSRNPPEWRIGANLTRGNPRDLHLAAVYEFDTEDAAYAAEKAAHEHFHEARHQKEWFRIRASDVAEWVDSAMGWRRRSN